MAVWNVSIFSLNMTRDFTFNNISQPIRYLKNDGYSMVINPFSSYDNISKATHDIFDGPPIGSVIKCMCNFNNMALYPELDDNDSITCQIWNACFMDINFIKNEKTISLERFNAGYICCIISLSLLLIGIILSIINFCQKNCKKNYHRFE